VAEEPSFTDSADSLDLEACMEQIAAQLKGVVHKGAPITHVMVGDVKSILATWEVDAFVNRGGVVNDALQRAVSARTFLNAALDQTKRGNSSHLGRARKAAHAEAALLQERVAEAKDARNIDAAVNLAASSKRLLAVIADAEKLDGAAMGKGERR
jgi:hypothetical protein